MQLVIILVYVVAIGAMMYFLAIKPQKKQQKQGVIIDITDDDVIVEFGNNKNCRISMQKKAIAQVEKPSAAQE